MLRNRQRLLSHLSRHFTLSAASVQVCMTVPVACVTSLSPSETDLNKLTPGNSGKSAKRKAAEALLQSRSVTASSHGDVEDTPLKRRHLSTAAHVCASTATHNSGSHLNAKQTSVSHWCDFDVCLPHLEWSRVVLSPALQVEKRLLPHPIRFPTYTLTNDVTVHVVEEASEVTEALRLLKDSMDDSMISIDLEWKPDYVRDTSRVALMQLSSSRCCLLLRLCKLGDQLPDALLEMFRDPNYTFLGFAWDSSDEKKMQRSFGQGKSMFTNFLDLQDVAQRLAYCRTGLAKLTQQVLGCAGYKSKRVSMSDWEARKLSPAQIQYAALDALVTGQVFRGLRLWESAPCACATCHHVLGKAMPEIALSCAHHTCRDRVFANLDSLAAHSTGSHHKGSVQMCPECGRFSLQLLSSPCLTTQ